jgi:hypothetical protein
MNGIELRKGIITNLATDIINKQLAAMLAMQRDMESTFEERKEEIVIFNKPHIGYIGVSFIEGNLRFIKGDGTTESSTNYIGNECYYETLLQIWHAFHNDR